MTGGDTTLLPPSVISTEKNRDKSLLEIINWRPWTYRGNDWRQILAAVKGRRGAGTARAEADQTESAAAAAAAAAQQQPSAAKEDADVPEPITARDKLHARCRTTLRTPRKPQTARVHRPHLATTMTTAKTSSISTLFAMLNVTRIMMGSVLKQVQEANLLRTGTTRNLITIRRTRSPSPAFVSRKHSRTGSPASGFCMPKKESLWFGKFSPAVEQDIRYYADEAQEALVIFTGLCSRTSQSARPVLTRGQFKRFLHKNNIDMMQTGPFLDHLQDLITTNSQYIDAADYLALLSILTKDVKQNRLQFAYMLYDLDNDGVVTSRDLFDLMRMNMHKLFPNDFRILCQLSNDVIDSQAMNVKTASDVTAGKALYLCLNEKAVEIRLNDWLHKNRGRSHSDVVLTLTRILYEQFRDASSPTTYPGLDGIGTNKRLAFTTKVFGTAHALSVFRRTAAVGNQLKASLEKAEATSIWSRDEVQVWLTMFWKASSGRNSITRSDLLELLSELEIEETAGTYFQRVFDPDNTNMITFENFLLTIGIMVRGDCDQILEMLFKMFDFDKNGVIRADEMFSVMECRWGQAIRDSLDCLLDAVVDKFNASTDSDPTVTHVCITWDEYRKVMVAIPEFWVKMAQRIDQIVLARSHQMRRKQHARPYSVHS